MSGRTQRLKGAANERERLNKQSERGARSRRARREGANEMSKLEELTHLNGGGDGGAADTVVSALKSKELLVPAALSAAGAIAVAKGPDLVHRLTDATESKGEEQAKAGATT